MSRITNLLIAFSSLEEEEQVLSQLRQHSDRGEPFHIVSMKDATLPVHWYGGSRNLQTGLLVGVYNHLDLPALLTFMQSMSWENPDEVQILIKEDEVRRFQLLDLFPEA